MKLEMICTGEEVLSGQIVDTNAAWFANAMMDHGIEMQRRITVGDRIPDLVDAFTERSLHADIILVNGGLGPTSDDLSAEAMAKALNVELVEHKEWRKHLEAWFAKHDRIMPESNLKQCYLPESAILVDNPAGSAPGFRVKFNNAWLFFTPGVPFEFKQMIEEQFQPFIQSEFSINQPTKLIKLLTLGHGESSLADKLETLTVPPGITIGYRPSLPHLDIKLFARGEAAIAALPDFLTLVKNILGNALVSENSASLAEQVHKLLINNKSTLSIAESCTGGLLTSQLITFAGSSHYLLQGLVTYSNESKISTLNISPKTLQLFSAVSIQTAHEMAQNILNMQKSNYALATTGIAGPEGGTGDKPVGTSIIALAIPGKTWIQSILLGNRSRTNIRQMTCAVALDMLRRAILELEPIVDYPFITRTDKSVITET